LLSPQAEQKNIEIVKLFNKTEFIEGIANELQQVFTNLIFNSIDAVSSVKTSGRITLKVFEETDFVIAEVSDDGCGIPAENLSRIYDPFFTTKELGKGTGLGLYICYGIVEKHNGNIKVFSEAGKGSTFMLKFPKKR
jgi:two-component system, NtrC family, sensor kinase